MFVLLVLEFKVFVPNSKGIIKIDCYRPVTGISFYGLFSWRLGKGRTVIHILKGERGKGHRYRQIFLFIA